MIQLPATSKATLSRLSKLRTRKGREESERFLAEGPRVVFEALSAGLPCRSLVFSAAAGEMTGEPVSPLFEAAVRSSGSSLPEREFRRICDTQTPQGVIGEFDQPACPPLERLRGLQGLLVVLDAVRDPGNAGSAIRCAAALGAEGVVLTQGCVDLWNSKTVRASAGAAFRIPIWREVETETLARSLADQAIPIWLAAPGGPSILEMAPPRGAHALVFGNEARGVGEAWGLVGGARKVSLPMTAGVESLNVANAVAAILGVLRAPLRSERDR